MLTKWRATHHRVYGGSQTYAACRAWISIQLKTFLVNARIHKQKVNCSWNARSELSDTKKYALAEYISDTTHGSPSVASHHSVTLHLLLRWQETS